MSAGYRPSCGCGASWVGLGIAHCGACHRTFSTVSNFDRHRQGGACNVPTTVGLVANERGIWHVPVDARQLARFAQLKAQR